MPLHALEETTFDSPSETELAYLAGLVDGEGSLLAGQPFKASGRNMGCPAIQVSMADRAAIEWCGEVFGGLVTTHGHASSGRTTYAWKMNRQADLRKLLPLLIPHLKIKGLQAWGVLRVVELLRSQRQQVVPTSRVPHNVRRLRKEQRQRWKAEVAQAQWGVREARAALIACNPPREKQQTIPNTRLAA